MPVIIVRRAEELPHEMLRKCKRFNAAASLVSFWYRRYRRHDLSPAGTIIDMAGRADGIA